MNIRIPIGRILSSAGKTLVTIGITAAAQALADAAARRLSCTDTPKL